MVYHLHNDTAECLGGLASGILVDLVRGGPEPVFSGGGVGPFIQTKEQNPVKWWSKY